MFIRSYKRVGKLLRDLEHTMKYTLESMEHAQNFVLKLYYSACRFVDFQAMLGGGLVLPSPSSSNSDDLGDDMGELPGDSVGEPLAVGAGGRAPGWPP